MPVPTEVTSLIRRFVANRDAYHEASYNETLLRRDFLDPLFKALGWDMDNSRSLPHAFREVIHEDSIKIGSSTKAPDYSFRVGGRRAFFLEAKRPSVSIQSDVYAAHQLRRYAWSANLPVSVLSDFEEFAIYDTRIKPDPKDPATTARILYVPIEDLEHRWDEIYALLSRDAVHAGSIDAFAAEGSRSRDTLTVDKAFLLEIESWRLQLAQDIARRNSGIDSRNLSFAVQATIDRIIFLRICEDRGIEPAGRLKHAADQANVYDELKSIFVDADDKYNSGLFHFRGEPGRSGSRDALTPSLEIGSDLLRNLIQSLYFPQSPYEFSVLPAEILGQVYERFLGSVIAVDSSGEATIDLKPEVRKAGGVYYTPTYIVDYMLDQTLGRITTGLAPKDLERLTVLDPACGSGTFLIGAYQYLLDKHLAWYLDNNPEVHARGRRPKLFLDRQGYRLTSEERRRILLNSIFGVDIDPQAVEVTKLSLLLKVLEGESSESVNAQLRLFHERALPDLDDNIKCGNTLVSHDYFDEIDSPDVEEEFRTNSFSWVDEFPKIFANDTKARSKRKRATNHGFDVVIGNPPYIDSEWMTTHWPNQRAYCSRRFEAASGNWDIFCVFIERALQLTKSNGLSSFIVPNKLGSAAYADSARSLLSVRNRLISIRDYSAVPVFPVSVYPIVYVAETTRPDPKGSVEFEKMHIGSSSQVEVERSESLPYLDYFGPGRRTWPIDAGHGAVDLSNKLESLFPELGSITLVTGAATVSEAYAIAPLLRDSETGSGYKFVNSGTLDRYAFLWGYERCRYLKRSYQHPRLLSTDLARISTRRDTQSRATKIIVAGMTKRLEAVYDSSGSVAAGKSTTLVMADFDLRYILAILNSRLIAYYYNSVFGGDRLAGGYLRVGKPQLSVIPVPDRRCLSTRQAEVVGRLDTLTDQMAALTTELLGQPAGHQRTLLTRRIGRLDQSIDRAVYDLYELDEAEVALVEDASI